MSGRGRPFKSTLPDIPLGPMTAELARTLWNYDPETGLITWAVSPRHDIQIGDKAGAINSFGYLILCFRKKKYVSSRIIWLIMTGELPKHEIDHIDCDQLNNRWANLREATSSQNKCNMRTRKDNILGVKGVSPNPWGKFGAYICVEGKRKNLGQYSTIAEAKAAYDRAAAEWHGEYRRS